VCELHVARRVRCRAGTECLLLESSFTLAVQGVTKRTGDHATFGGGLPLRHSCSACEQTNSLQVMSESERLLFPQVLNSCFQSPWWDVFSVERFLWQPQGRLLVPCMFCWSSRRGTSSVRDSAVAECRPAGEIQQRHTSIRFSLCWADWTTSPLKLLCPAVYCGRLCRMANQDWRCPH
jgi:hypothetical protein